MTATSTLTSTTMTNGDADLPTWIETKTADNKVYYYNAITKETTWKRPENARILKYEQLAKQQISNAAISRSISASTDSAPTKQTLPENIVTDGASTSTSSDANRQLSTNAVDFAENKGEAANIISDGTNHGVASSSAVSAGNNVNSTNNSSKSEQQQKDRLRPVSTTAIPGTPWCVVWTDKDSVFYFNPSTKTSVWARPEELKCREDVDKLVSSKLKSKSRTDESSYDGHQSPEKKIKYDDYTDDENSRDSQNRAAASSSVATKSSSAATTIAPKIVKKDAPSEIETEAAKKRETIPFKERVETFRALLEEKEVNPASTFPRELSKIVFDPRYLLLTSQERKEVFEKYCLEKVEEDRRKRRSKMKKAADDFKTMCSEANLTPMTTFGEFYERHSKDPRFKALEKTKDRELLFEDHLAYLRNCRKREERRNDYSMDRRYDKRGSEKSSRRQSLPRDEAEDTFNAILIELITDTEFSWHDAKKILRKSPQYDLLDELPREWKQAAFEKHCERLFTRRKDKFHQLLSETKEIVLDSDWRNVRRLIREDPRYIKFSSSDKRCEREFREFLKAKISKAKADFGELVRETKLIDSNTRKTIEDSQNQHLIDIIGTLQSDKRYKDLEPLSEERRKILLCYIEELAAASNGNDKARDEADDIETAKVVAADATTANTEDKERPTTAASAETYSNQTHS